MSVLINELISGLREEIDTGKRLLMEQLLCMEYESELKKAGFNIEKVYRTKDDRWKVSRPVQCCRKNKMDCLKAVYEYYYGNLEKTLGDVYNMWIRSFSVLVEQGHRSSITLDSYRCYYNRYIAASPIKDTPIRNIRTVTLHDFYAQSAVKDNLTRKSLNNLKALINHIFDFAILKEYIEINYAKEVSIKDLILRDKKNSYDVYSNEERNKLIEVLKDNKGDPCSNAITVLFCTGMRTGEVRALKWEDVNFSEKTIYIHREIVRKKNINGKTEQVCVNHTKARKEAGNRIVPIPREAMAALKKQRELNPSGEYVFMVKGSLFHQNLLNKALKKYCWLAGVKYLSCHKIRFWAVTAMYAAGISQAIIQRTVGHLIPATTDHYKRISKLGCISLADAERICRNPAGYRWLSAAKGFLFRKGGPGAFRLKRTPLLKIS